MANERNSHTLVEKDFHDDRPKTINMLLDITNYFGESEKRLGPALKFLAVSGSPIIIYIYFLFEYISLKWLIAPYIIFVIIMAFIILGDQKKRLRAFKKMLFDIYASAYSLMNIKPIHDDGILEYNNGNIALGVIIENGTDIDIIVKSNMLTEILDKMAVVDNMDVHTQNISEVEALRSRYSGISNIKDTEVAKDYVKIIDSYIRKATEESLVTRTIVMLKGPKYKVEIMEDAIDEVLGSQYVGVFKVFKRATKAELESIIMRDVGTYINFEEMLMNRFATDVYFDSEVLDYDVKDEGLDKKQLRAKKASTVNTRGFMITEDDDE